MSETIERYFLPPPPHVLLWRYMSFTQFVALLEHQGLFFARASRFEDSFEGSYPRKLVEAGPPHLIRHPAVAQLNRHLVLVSSWHRNEHESAALWRLYAAESGGIAIIARSGDLAEALPADVLFGEIRYLDYETESFPGRNVLYPFIHKRKSFEHEREVRALIWQHGHDRRVELFNDPRAQDYAGVWLPTGLGFISAVKVAPSAPRWLEELTSEVAARYGLNVPVTRSDMDRGALF